MTVLPASPARPRFVLIDALRGIAILAMVMFHIAWDLYFLGFIGLDISTDPWWTAFQKAIVSSFLALAGISLWFAHGRGIRWQSFWRREAILVGSALAVSAGTWFAFGDYFAFFGVLHAIALFSLLTLAFLRLQPLLTAAIGLAIIIAPLLITHPVMRERWLAWIGFWPISPATADIVPVFPWLGVVLLGLAFAKALDGHPLWGLKAPRLLALLGRWSLVIYLLHQPVLYGGLYGLRLLMPQPGIEQEYTAFIESCRATRLQSVPDALAAERYCGCALEQVQAGNMWDMLSRERTAVEETEVEAMMGLCDAMSRQPIADVPPPNR